MELIQGDIRIGGGIFHLYRKDDGTYLSKCISMSPCKSSTTKDQSAREDMKPRIVAEFESSTKPGTYHYVTYFPSSGEYKCSCYGFRSPNKCWHYREAVKRNE
jgi:hypothetical protein